MSPGYFGWFSNALPGYPDTLNLPLEVVTQELEYRPELVLSEGDHPLIREQREGITTDAHPRARRAHDASG